MSSARILLVDDHKLMRAGLRALIEGAPGMSVIGEADDGAMALEMVRRDSPDIVITDISMRGIGGLELLAVLQREFPQVRVVILSMHAEKAYVDQTLGTGARAYLLKDAAMEELHLALQAVLKGDIYLSPGVSTKIIDGFIRNAESAQDVLTPRQREILKMLAEGISVREIARMGDTSVKTVEAHRAQIMERLNIRDIAGLVRYAVRTGLVNIK